VGIRGRADQQTVQYALLALMLVAGEESADEAAVRERSIELLFSKKDLGSAEYKAVFRKLCLNEAYGFIEKFIERLGEKYDIRELEDMNRISADEGGDLYLVNGNLLPLRMAGAFAKTNQNESEDTT
jgi:hypothetical protein